MLQRNRIEEAVLSYPVSTSIKVYRDDGNWDKYDRWWQRPTYQTRDLYVVNVDLRTDDQGDVDLSHSEWVDAADALLRDYPDSVFIYTSN